MKLTLATLPGDLPAALRPLLEQAEVFDSSCSEEARVFFIDKDGGYFLKRAPAGSLAREATLTRWFHGKGLAARVLDYIPEEAYDWLLTEKIHGDDLCAAKYIEQPERLTDALADCLRMLHGDFCLPNIIINDWRFSGFIDLGSGGAGDRHWDIFWALWTLQHNLHTDQYGERFLEAYGRSLVDDDRLRLCAAIVAM